MSGGNRLTMQLPEGSDRRAPEGLLKSAEMSLMGHFQQLKGARMSPNHPNQPLLRIRNASSAERSRDRSLAYCVRFVGISEIVEGKAQASF
jgi:hypothetical protein